jgi:hypothetical protein
MVAKVEQALEDGKLIRERREKFDCRRADSNLIQQKGLTPEIVRIEDHEICVDRFPDRPEAFLEDRLRLAGHQVGEDSLLQAAPA